MYLYEVVNIKTFAKNSNIILLVIIMIVFIGIFCTALCAENSNDTFKDNPSYTVINKWYDNDGKKVNLNNFETDCQTTLYTEIIEKNCNNAKLIIKTNNLSINAHTNGKKLYNSDDSKYSGYGEYYNIIDISDVNDNGEIYLQLTPKDNLTGSISNDIYITTQNDFLMHLLSTNKIKIICISIVIMLLAIYDIWIIKRLFISRKGIGKHIYLNLTIALLITIIATKSNLLYFIIQSNMINYICLYSGYMLLPTSLMLLYNSLLTKRKYEIILLQWISIGYFILRMLLFIIIPVAFEKGIIISHLLLCTVIITMIILSIKEFRKKYLVDNNILL
jgi:hypothetical protein